MDETSVQLKLTYGKYPARRMDSAGLRRAATPPQSATSARLDERPAPAKADSRDASRNLPASFPPEGTPFFGMKIGAGGVILFTAEKLRSFSASPTRPRESTYSSGSPTGTSMNVFAYGAVNDLLFSCIVIRSPTL